MNARAGTVRCGIFAADDSGVINEAVGLGVPGIAVPRARPSGQADSTIRGWRGQAVGHGLAARGE
jgi:hypothetical protein